MLVLARKKGETIRLPDVDVTIHISDIRGRTVRVGIEAPEQITVIRGELEEHPRREAAPETETQSVNE